MTQINAADVNLFVTVSVDVCAGQCVLERVMSIHSLISQGQVDQSQTLGESLLSHSAVNTQWYMWQGQRPVTTSTQHTLAHSSPLSPHLLPPVKH